MKEKDKISLQNTFLVLKQEHSNASPHSDMTASEQEDQQADASSQEFADELEGKARGDLCSPVVVIAGNGNRDSSLQPETPVSISSSVQVTNDALEQNRLLRMKYGRLSSVLGESIELLHHAYQSI